VLSGRGLCDELVTRPEESYRLRCVVVCDLETSRMGAPYIYNVRLLRVNKPQLRNFQINNSNLEFCSCVHCSAQIPVRNPFLCTQGCRKVVWLQVTHSSERHEPRCPYKMQESWQDKRIPQSTRNATERLNSAFCETHINYICYSTGKYPP